MADVRLLQALFATGPERVTAAFRRHKFVYGTQGTGSAIVRFLKVWAGAKTVERNGQKIDYPGIRRQLNLFDPGRRANLYLSGDHQMMDLYYGQAGTVLHEKRDPAIGEFVHRAMGFSGRFSMAESGRDAYLRSFNTTIEG